MSLTNTDTYACRLIKAFMSHESPGRSNFRGFVFKRTSAGTKQVASELSKECKELSLNDANRCGESKARDIFLTVKTCLAPSKTSSAVLYTQHVRVLHNSLPGKQYP